MAQKAARYAVNEAHLARALQAHSAEAQRMVIPEAIRPVHNNTIKSILKKYTSGNPLLRVTGCLLQQSSKSQM